MYQLEKGGERMWKLLIRILRCKKIPYIRMIKIRDEIYTVRIEKYESINMLIQRMKEALDAETSKAR